MLYRVYAYKINKHDASVDVNNKYGDADFTSKTDAIRTARKTLGPGWRVVIKQRPDFFSGLELLQTFVTR